MTDDQWQRQMEIFDAACDIPEDERDAYLAEACGDDEALLESVRRLLAQADKDESLHIVSEAAADLVSEQEERTSDAPGELKVGEVVGPYTIEERLGSGGFAVVYLAQQESPVRRRVALKVLKAGMDSEQILARFSAERQAVALMEHENIAKFFDAGISPSGRPYFVMELVPGEPITTYCDRTQQSLSNRVKLMQQACSAVQHAHQKGVIHRDLKPSNVLVTESEGKPVVKVIDFGVAKAVGDPLTAETIETRQGFVIGTPEYMSPEQAGGMTANLDTRTDVYSLGVLLYELLVGAPPFDLRNVAVLEIQRTIREVDPPRPSMRLSRLASAEGTQQGSQATSARQLQGDLDWIVMKALEKDRERRYDSAVGLADDINRFLRDEVVLAGPPSATYRFRKFAKRNRTAVWASAAVAVALVAGTFGTTIGLVRALDEKQRADESAETARLEAARATEVKQFLQSMLSSVSPSVAQGLDTTLMDQILTDAKLDLENRDFADRRIEAELRVTIGSVAVALGDLEEAESYLQEAYGIRQHELGEDAVETLETRQLLGQLYIEKSDFQQAEEILTQVLEARRRVLGDDHPSTITTLVHLGPLMNYMQKLDEADRYLVEAIERASRTLGSDDILVYEAKHALADTRNYQGDFDEAEQLFRETIAGYRQQRGDDNPDTIKTLHNLANFLKTRERFEEATALSTEALERGRRVLGADHPNTVTSLLNLAIIAREQGNYAEAESLHLEAIERFRRSVGDDHNFTVSALNSYLVTLVRQGKMETVLDPANQILEIRRRTLGNEHPATLVSMTNVGYLFVDLERFAEAEEYYREALDGRQRVLGPDHPETLRTNRDLGRALKGQGKIDEALMYFQNALEGYRSTLGEDANQTLNMLDELGRYFYELERWEDAETYLAAAYTGWSENLESGHPRVRLQVIRLAGLRNERGRFEDALSVTAPAIELAAGADALDDASFGHLYRQHAEALIGLEQTAAAESALLTAKRVFTEALGESDEQTREVDRRLSDLYEQRDSGE